MERESVYSKKALKFEKNNLCGLDHQGCYFIKTIRDKLDNILLN